MKQAAFLFLSFFLFFSCSRKKLDYSEKAVDSIPIYLVLANEDSVPYQKRLDYNKRVFDVFINQENDSMNRVNLFKIANRYFNMGNMKEYKKTTHIVLKKALTDNDMVSIAKAYRYLGDYYMNSAIRDSAFLYYTKAGKIYQKKNDKVNLGGALVNIATIQGYENDFLGSELTAIKALEVLKHTHKKSYIYEAYNLLGIISNELKDYEKALEYHTKALDLTDDNDFDVFHQKAVSLNNIGSVYQNDNKDNIAIEKFEEALQDKKLFAEKVDLYVLLLDNLAYSKLKTKNYSQLPDLFYKALKIRDSLNFKTGTIYNKLHLSEFYLSQKDTLTAQKFGDEALLLSRDVKNSEGILNSLKQLAVVNPAKASVYREEYIKIRDSIRLKERRIQDKFARIRYEADEMIIEKDRAVLQKWAMFWIAVSVLLSSLVFYVFCIRRIKQRELLLLLSRQKADEEIYHLMSDLHQKFEEGRKKEKRRIARELHDGVLSRLTDIRTSLLVLENKADSETVRYCISQVTEIQDVEKEVRDIAHGLGRDLFFPKRDYPELLASVIADSANKTTSKINLKIDKTVDWNVLDSRKKLGVYQILQECLHVLAKQGANVTIRFYKNNSLLVMEIDSAEFDAKNHEKEQVLKDIELKAKEMDADLRISNILDWRISLKIIILMKTDQNF